MKQRPKDGYTPFMRALLVGNYGVGNLGDEALRKYFLSAFPHIAWQVLSAQPDSQDLPRLPGGLRSLLGTRWLRTIKAIRQADVVVFGGGSLFTDVESSYACFLWWLHAKTAYILGTPVFLAFQGIGPFRTRIGEWFAHDVVKNTVFISVRDNNSGTRVKSWKKNTEVIQTFDPVFLLLENKKSTRNTKNVLTIVPRKNSGEMLENEVKKILLQQSFASMSIVLLQPDDHKEKQYATTLRDRLSTGVDIVEVRTLDELQESISESTFIVTQRFHGAIAALAMGIPVRIVTQGAGDKLSSLQPFAEDPSKVGDLHRLVQGGETALQKAFAAL